MKSSSLLAASVCVVFARPNSMCLTMGLHMLLCAQAKLVSSGVELHIRALAWARKRWERLPGLRWCALPIVVEFV